MNLEPKQKEQYKQGKEMLVKEIIELVRKLPDSEFHIFEAEGKQCITQEWLCGGFAGRSFEADSLEEATQEMIDYFYKHLNHDSIVGMHVTRSGFPDLSKMEKYCLSFIEEDLVD